MGEKKPISFCDKCLEEITPHISVYCCKNCQKDIMDGFFFMLDHYCNKECCIKWYKRNPNINIEEIINKIKI